MGPGISNDTILFTKLIRICIAFLEKHKLSTTSSVDPIIKEQTPPPNNNNGTSASNTATKESPKKKESTIEMILLKMFPYLMRYYLYNNWCQFSYKHFRKLIRAKAECQEKIKYLLK